MTTHLLQETQVLLKRYRIDSYIAEGGMQQVYRATDLAFQRQVAVKVPKNTSAEKRFARSAQVSARITHANVAKTLDYFEIDTRAYLVEELIHGIDLDEALRDKYFYLDPHLGAHFLHLFAKGIAAAHHADVFHRDLKPSNIMIGVDPNMNMVKITDFGIAKMAASVMEEAIEGGEESITSSQTMVGSLPYMAPEMIDDPKTATKPADIWALGAIMYRLISGELPFGSGLRAIPIIMQANLPAKPQFLSKAVQFSTLGDEIWRIIASCLQKDPASRPSADDLVSLCSSLCYSEATRTLATVESVGNRRGRFGFLRDDAGKPIFFHLHSCYGSVPAEGSRVLTATFPGTPYPRAFPVLPLK